MELNPLVQKGELRHDEILKQVNYVLKSSTEERTIIRIHMYHEETFH